MERRTDRHRVGAYTRDSSRWRRTLAWASTQFRGHDTSTTILLVGLAGLLGVLVIDWILTMAVEGKTPVEAFYSATWIVATVGPGEADKSPLPWFVVTSSVFILLTIVFTAIFTAGLVNRVLSRRTIGIVGRRTIPTRDHVAIVGLGQVGVRLALRLLALGVPVLVVERDEHAPNLRLAKSAGIPVLIANVKDRYVFDRLALPRALALAAMGSNDLDNVEVVIAAPRRQRGHPDRAEGGGR